MVPKVLPEIETLKAKLKRSARTKSPLKETTHGNVTSKENTDDGDEGRQNR